MKDPLRPLGYALALFALLYFLLPLLWLLVAPFRAEPSFGLAPGTPSLEAFRRLWENPYALRSFGNSLLIAGGSMLLTTLLTAPAAYALARGRFPGRDLLLYLLVLLSSVVTGTAAMVPLYTLTLRLGLLDTHLGVILALSGGLLPTALFLLRDFLDGLPRAYEEASLVDGAPPLLTLRRVVLPLAAPGVAVAALLTFVHAWSNFLIPFILLRDPGKAPAAVTVYTFFNEVGLPYLNQIAAYALLYSLPVLLLYLLVQRAFGFRLFGGLKG